MGFQMLETLENIPLIYQNHTITKLKKIFFLLNYDHQLFPMKIFYSPRNLITKAKNHIAKLTSVLTTYVGGLRILRYIKSTSNWKFDDDSHVFIVIITLLYVCRYIQKSKVRLGRKMFDS